MRELSLVNTPSDTVLRRQGNAAQKRYANQPNFNIETTNAKTLNSNQEHLRESVLVCLFFGRFQSIQIKMDLAIDKPEDKKIQNEPSQSPEFAPYPKIDPKDVSPPPPININNAMESQSQADLSKTKSPSKSVSWSTELTREAPSSRPEESATTMPTESDNNNSDYVTASPPLDSQPKSASVTVKDTVNTVKTVLGRWGKKVGETSKKSQDIAGNVWQHLKTGPSFADAAMGRVAQGAKVLAEGGYEKIFRQTFDTVPEEELQRTYACYLSTSAGPVMGILYLSTAKLAFCSDNPLPYKIGEQNEWSYYKVVIPLHQLKAVNTSTSKVNRAEKYIQVISVDNHEFWFMGFVNYDSAVKYLQDVLQDRNLESG